MTLDARLSSAARALDVLPTARRDIRVVRRRSLRRRCAAGVVALALVAVGIGLLRTGSSDAARSIYAGPTQGGGPIDVHGLTVDLPPTWQVVEHQCPGQDRTMLVGAADEHASCAVPDPAAGWIWLQPVDDTTLELRRSCTPGFMNDIPICQSVDFATDVETLFIDGVDLVVVRHTQPRDADFGTDDFPVHYSDPQRPEAQGAGHPRGGYELEQPLMISQDAVRAYLDGDCVALRSLTDSTYEGGCPDPVPDATVGGAQLTSVGGAVSTESARVTASPNLAFDVELQHEWSTSTKRGQWRIVSITSIDPSTPIPQATLPLPACVGVVDHSGRVVGCTRNSDLHPSDPTQVAPGTTEAGAPVYADESSDEVVGYIGELGFVPVALMPRFAEVKACSERSLALLQSQTTEELSDTCRALLVAQGIPEANLPAR